MYVSNVFFIYYLENHITVLQDGKFHSGTVVNPARDETPQWTTATRIITTRMAWWNNNNGDGLL